MKKTVVLGASTKDYRYSYKAICLLNDHDIEIIAIGSKPDEIRGIEIHSTEVPVEDVHTVTIYLNASRQIEYYDYILRLKPKRIIFNPGTENDELKELAIKNGIEVVEHCTLVMLNFGTY